MLRLWSCVLVGLVVAAVVPAGRPEADAASPFAPWDGTWQGIFTSYTPEGEVRYRMEVRQEYQQVHAGTQKGVFVTRLPGKEPETVHAVNIVENGMMYCRVRTIGPDGKASGPVREHIGRRIGPGQIFWYADLADGRFETFNERVEGDTYTIHGVGVYGPDAADRQIFEGRYRRQ